MDLAKKSIFKGFESPVCWMCLCYDVRKESKEEYMIRGGLAVARSAAAGFRYQV